MSVASRSISDGEAGDGDRDPFQGTALDATIDKIGMGYYQWSLLGLCGFGWMADNMWLEAIAIALPRVQDHFSVSNNHIGWLMTSMFGGMMFGAVGWGNCSDVLGRRLAFNATLVLSAIFGLIVSLAPTYPTLCLSLFLLGTAVGGSIPTDGTLFLENLPRRKRYLLTLLSVFFSIGGVVAALIAILLVPDHSCPEGPEDGSAAPPCDVDTQNMGWKYLFFALAAVTATMFVCRVFLFRLHESPRYLVRAGRHEDAVYALQQITKINGLSIELGLTDVDDRIIGFPLPDPDNLEVPDYRPSSPSNTPPHYLSTDNRMSIPSEGALGNDRHLGVDRTHFSSETGPPRSSALPAVRLQSLPKEAASILGYLPKGVTSPFLAWSEKSAELLSPQWKRTTLLMWASWMFMSLAYTIFNVYFPKLVELRLGEGAVGGSRKKVLWDVVVFTLGGTPGAIIGAWMVETHLGRRKSLALSTAATGLLCLIFASVTGSNAIVLTSMGISLTSTIMWAVLYGMTPEMFVTEVRGTACGNASALNRVSGMIGPLLGGFLLGIDISFPVYVAAVTFLLGAACAIALPFESAEGVEMSDKISEPYTLLH